MKYIKTYENFKHILESRKEDLEKKFIKNFGKGLGESIYDLDSTKNKSYSEWLLKFFKLNRKELNISNTLNLPRKEMDKKKWNDDINKLNTLKLMIKKFDNNKKDFSLPITKINTLDDLKNILDEKDNFNDIYNFNENEVIIYYDSLEWLIFQPFEYEISEIGNRKNRKSNWCTTYNENNFDSYLGNKGALLYCINKLDYKQDMAFQLRPNETIVPWDYKDNSKDILNSFYEMKYEFENDSEIYNIIDKIEHKLNFPEISKEELKENVTDYYDSFDFDTINIDQDIYEQLLNSSNYMIDYIDNEINYYSNSFVEFLESYDDEMMFSLKYLLKHDYKNEFIKHFNVNELPHNIELFKKSLQINDSDNLELYEQFEIFISQEDINENIVNDYFNNRYDNYSATDLINDIYGSTDLINQTKNYVDYNDYVEFLINDMSTDEMLEIAFP